MSFMLSRLDIEKELGKNICIYPLNMKNFKENSINLCAGYYAWSLSDGTVYYDERTKKFFLEKSQSKSNDPNVKTIHIKRGKNLVKGIGKEKYIILLPQATTLIETKEVLATGSNIGGTYHSKVGLVSQGIGHIGTMLGPNFSGHSLIAIHNITKNIITLKVGDSFVSVVFHYLNTPIYDNNPTVSGHVDKMAEWGISLTSQEREDLSSDWKSDIARVRNKMISSNDYKEYCNQKKNQKSSIIKQYVNSKNIFIFIILIVVVMALGGISYFVDSKFSTTVWSERYWTVITSAIIIPVLMGSLKLFSKK